MSRKGTTITFHDKEVNPDAILDRSSAQFQTWLAQIKRDHGQLTGREMEQAEIAIGGRQKTARCMYNPFTGEFKRIKLGDF
jgi:hypothetical protein